ncbi:pentatricopeptide repeat-containing protein At5g48910-like [Telopea speciosissima]|uniref:pentatricopeptide repeat-containing protein At5g48910-like n=1 Tax=Telopea speciosissima TaxID=54955 RepID=UPI001CC4DBFC|nr:pentatricopeptide repeat-containing protein At5g48910-like [Telopea speciosissima]
MLCGEFVEPNGLTFPSVLKACTKMAKVEEGMQRHGQVIKRGLESDEFIASNLLRLNVVCGLMKEAFLLFNKSRECDESFKDLNFNQDAFGGNDFSNSITEKRKQEGIVVLYNVMIDGCMRHGDFEAARKLFDEMPQRSIVSWNGILAGYAQNGFFKDALEIFP